MTGVPYRVVVLKGSTVVRRGDVGLALPSSVVGSALRHAPVGAQFHSMGITYEKAALPCRAQGDDHA